MTSFIRFAQNSRFVGRTELLEDLHQRLLDKEDCPRVALHGLGGIGKTQVALAFVYELEKDFPDLSVFWISAISEEELIHSYQEICRLLDIEIPEGREPRIIERVYDHLRRPSAGRWLLVFDSVDSPEHFLHLPWNEFPQSPLGAMLLTTRTKEIATRFAGDEVLEVRELVPYLSQELFTSSLIDKSLAVAEPDANMKLFEELTHLPLAITQAAAYINMTGTSILEYLDLLRSTEETLLQALSLGFDDRYRYFESVNAVAATWLGSFQRIKREDEITIQVLSIIACIEPVNIPSSLLVDDVAIDKLSAYAFITQRGQGFVFDMHRLVRVAARHWLRTQPDFSTIQSQVVDHINEAFPWPCFENRDACYQLRPHAEALLGDFRGTKDKSWLKLTMKVGSSLHRDGQIKDALHYYSQGWQWAEEALPEDDHNRMISQWRLAVVYRNDGQYKEAIELLENVVQIQAEKKLDVQEQANTKHLLATVYKCDGQVDRSIEMLEQVVKVQSSLPEDDEDRLQSQHALSCAYEENNQTEKAMEVLEPVVRIRKAILSDCHPSLLTTQHQLAVLYQSSGRVDEAIDVLELVVQAEKKTYLENDPTRLASQHELARAYMTVGRLDEAISLFELVVSIKEGRLRLGSQQGLALAYFHSGRVDDAEKLLIHVVQSYKEFLPADHTDLLRAENSLQRVCSSR